MANNEPLRRMLRDRFRDHQVDPSPGLEKAILSKVAPSSPWWKSVGGKAAMGIGGLLVGGAAWLLYPVPQATRESLYPKLPKSTEVQAKTIVSAPQITSILTVTGLNEANSGELYDTVQGPIPFADQSRPTHADSQITTFRVPSFSVPVNKTPTLGQSMVVAEKQSLAHDKDNMRPTPDHEADALVKRSERVEELAMIDGLTTKKSLVRKLKNRVRGFRVVSRKTGAYVAKTPSTRQPGRLSNRYFSSLPTSDLREQSGGPMLDSKLPATAIENESGRQFFISKLVPKSYRIAEVGQKMYGIVLPSMLANSALTKPRSRRVSKSIQFDAGIVAGSQLVYQVGYQPRLSWAAGVWGAVPLSSKFSLETGLTVSQPTVVTRQEVIGVVMVDSIPSRQSVKQTQRWWNLNVPLLVRYHIMANPRWRWSLAAGLSSAGSINATQISDYTITKLRNSADTTSQGTVSHVQTVTPSPRAVLFQPFRWLHVSSAIEFANVGGHKLSLEPYINYPIGGVTEQSLRVGMAGLQLRLQLRPRSTHE